MNSQQYRRAVKRMLDSEAPDVHIEVLLLFGARPHAWAEFGVVDMSALGWDENVKGYLILRYGFSAAARRRHQLAVCLRVIADRIDREVEKSEYQGYE